MIKLDIRAQPDDETCGPTCLHAIYRYYGANLSLKKIIEGLERSLSGGTLSPLLGKHALMNGFKAVIFVNQLEIFDPTWFDKSKASQEALLLKLKNQDKFKRSKGFLAASNAFQGFLTLGGEIRFQTIDAELLQRYFKQKIPILTGLNSTYLYRTAREVYTPSGESVYDDISGEACGHFVVLCGYDKKKMHAVIADPFRENPMSNNHFYTVSVSRLINAIMLGARTFDASLLMITPSTDITL